MRSGAWKELAVSSALAWQNAPPAFRGHLGRGITKAENAARLPGPGLSGLPGQAQGGSRRDEASMHFQFDMTALSYPTPQSTPAASADTPDLLRQMLEVQKEQLG